MKALVLAAGQGKNLEPLTANRPKPMVPLSGQPVLERLLRMIRAGGISQVEIVVGHGRETIQEHLGRGDELGLDLHYAIQDQQHGIGQAILEASPELEQEEFFLLVYGDVVTAGNIVVDTLDQFGSLGQPVAAVSLPASSEHYGNVYMEGDMRIVRLLEKPGRDDLGNYVLAGVFVLPGTLFKRLRDCQGDLLAALNGLMSHEGLYASIWGDDWIDLSFPWDILSANRIIMDAWTSTRIARDVRIPGSVELRGPVIIEPGVRIEAGASLLGPCFIGRDSYIGHNVLVRPYTSLGPGCTVGFAVELRNSVIFQGVEVGRLSFIGDSVLGREVDLGPGIMTVNRNMDSSVVSVPVGGKPLATGLQKLGALIGDGARIGAGNTLLPGTSIPAGSLVPHRGYEPDSSREA